MLVAIISDIHDNLVNLGKCLEWCLAEGVEETICCGDVTNTETLNILANTFTNPIHLVRGNIELYREEDVAGLANINYFGKAGRIDLDGAWVGLCHEPGYIDKVLNQGTCEVIFYGHTHKPWDDMKNNVRIVNPGNLAGFLYKATFAVWDTTSDKLELKLLERM